MNNLRIPLLAGLAFLLFTPSTLFADGQDDLHFGAQVYTALPSADLGTMTRRGWGGGVFLEQEFTESSIIQTRLDYVQYSKISNPFTPSGTRFIPTSPLRLSVDEASFGVEVRHYLPIKALTRCYGLLGLSAVRFEFKSIQVSTSEDIQGIATTVITPHKEKSSMKCGLTLGVGYQFSPSWAGTVRYNGLAVEGLSLATVETGISLRF